MLKVRRVYINRFEEVVTDEILEVESTSSIAEILNHSFVKIQTGGISFHREDGDSVYWEVIEEEEPEPTVPQLEEILSRYGVVNYGARNLLANEILDLFDEKKGE